MDALAALWLMSIIGAAGFTATGFFLARSRMPATDPAPVITTQETEPKNASTESSEPAEAAKRVEAADPAEPAKPAEPAEHAEPAEPPESPRTTARPPDVVARAASIPAPRKDPRREEGEDPHSDDHGIEVIRASSDAPRRAASVAPAPTAPAPVGTSELERQLHALRVELRAEVVARNKIETHARELAGRLSSLSSPQKMSSIIPSAASDARNRLSARAPGLFAEIDALKIELARVTAENDSLRLAALGAPAARPRMPTGSANDHIVPEALKRMVDRIARLDNVSAAAVAESSGLVLAGSGELADALAAFGAYMKDAASRSERLLPLRATREVTVRDSHGLVFSTRVLGKPESELALVTLSLHDIAAREIRDIVTEAAGL